MKEANAPVYAETLQISSKNINWLMGISTLLAVGLPLVLGYKELQGLKLLFVLGIAAFMGLSWWVLLVSHIRLRLDGQGIHYQFWPFKKHSARWHKLEKCYLRKVDPFGEFGGWGLRFISPKQWGFVNTSSWAIQLVYKDGLKVTVSTQRPEAIKDWLSSWSPVAQPVK